MAWIPIQLTGHPKPESMLGDNIALISWQAPCGATQFSINYFNNFRLCYFNSWTHLPPMLLPIGLSLWRLKKLSFNLMESFCHRKQRGLESFIFVLAQPALGIGAVSARCPTL